MLLVEMTVKCVLKYFVDIWTQIKYTTITFVCLTLRSAQDHSSSGASLTLESHLLPPPPGGYHTAAMEPWLWDQHSHLEISSDPSLQRDIPETILSTHPKTPC